LRGVRRCGKHFNSGFAACACRGVCCVRQNTARSNAGGGGSRGVYRKLCGRACGNKSAQGKEARDRNDRFRVYVRNVACNHGIFHKRNFAGRHKSFAPRRVFCRRTAFLRSLHEKNGKKTPSALNLNWNRLKKNYKRLQEKISFYAWIFIYLHKILPNVRYVVCGSYYYTISGVIMAVY